MSNTSASGGYLAPSGVVPEDDDLDDLLQEIIAGVTGLDPTLVRPRWQETPPQVPEADVDWCAMGVISTSPKQFARVAQTDEGAKVVEQERLEILCSFYGRRGQGFAKLLRTGLQVWQNRQAMRANGLGFVETSVIRSVPEILNMGSRRRADITVVFNRETVRTYDVETILSANGSVRASSGLVDSFDTTNGAPA